MIYCKELEQNFNTKEELFKSLRENETKILDIKKAAVHKSIDKGQGLKANYDSVDSEVVKADATFKDGFIYPVINTIGILDSHNDLHISGLWNKSVREQQGKVFYVADHELETTKVITWKDDVKMLVKDVSWSMVGKPYEGKTQALIFEIEESKIRLEAAKNIIRDKKDVENSVRMKYYNIVLCYDSDKDEDKQYKKNFDKYYPMIANKEEVGEVMYFYAVLEAGIVSEGSMVLMGSNDATRVVQVKDEPLKDTQQKEEEAANSSHQSTTSNDNRFIYLTI